MTDQKIAVHQKVFTIAWGDMDALGHVNNARYFDYFQQARIEWIESIQLDMQQSTGPVVVQVGCTFLKPIVYPATLTLTSTLQKPGRTSLIVEHEIYQDGILMTQGMSKIVWVDYVKQQSVALPEEITRLFKDLG